MAKEQKDMRAVYAGLLAKMDIEVSDGMSTERMLQKIEKHIAKHGQPASMTMPEFNAVEHLLPAAKSADKVETKTAAKDPDLSNLGPGSQKKISKKDKAAHEAEYSDKGKKGKKNGKGKAKVEKSEATAPAKAETTDRKKPHRVSDSARGAGVQAFREAAKSIGKAGVSRKEFTDKLAKEAGVGDFTIRNYIITAKKDAEFLGFLLTDEKNKEGVRILRKA